MNLEDIRTEGHNRYLTRLGILAGDQEPTAAQKELAANEAREFEECEKQKLQQTHYVHNRNESTESNQPPSIERPNTIHTQRSLL